MMFTVSWRPYLFYISYLQWNPMELRHDVINDIMTVDDIIVCLQDTPSYFSCLGASELMLPLINCRVESSLELLCFKTLCFHFSATPAMFWRLICIFSNHHKTLFCGFDYNFVFLPYISLEFFQYNVTVKRSPLSLFDLCLISCHSYKISNNAWYLVLKISFGTKDIKKNMTFYHNQQTPEIFYLEVLRFHFISIFLSRCYRTVYIIWCQ